MGNVTEGDVAYDWFDNFLEPFDEHNYHPQENYDEYNTELPDEWYQHQMFSSTQGHI